MHAAALLETTVPPAYTVAHHGRRSGLRRHTVTTRIYHNPRCSKSRATLELLRARDIEPDVIEYLVTPPTRDEIESLVRLLGCPVRDIVRFDDSAFAESGLSRDADSAALLTLLAERPQLLQRPIVVHGNRARVGRPPERVLELFA
jgi:arsenate reductase